MMPFVYTDEQLGIPQLVDIPTLARILGDSVRHIRRLVAENRIPYIKVGHFIRFDLREIARWLDSHRHHPLPDGSVTMMGVQTGHRRSASAGA
jgi:excisionase family DNA binding protein